ncbi:ABC transporter ATP-binding protein [Nocardioides sp. BP30]|uniref:ABC transporter ATP-binding protein n=1 Tax=Nocardioides sp. BP30 TaxID=3036374 RepID=UPI00246825A9|nr:ABC transporter ATP-binding protein [Nocardioides sp. BP30]WGL53976.1 ABC transporter ATP-binding protein [Nocardioides sp. BP30]
MSGARGLRFENVDKSYTGRQGSVAALDDFTLEIAEGEFVAVLGPSGCGKSTALRIAAGLEEPDRGSITIDGASPAQVVGRRQMGVAFQDNALLPWLTVRANVELPFKLARQRVDRERVSWLLELVGLAEFARHRPGQLSGGMRQRVSIARSLALRPQVLLLDEPFGALDAVTRHRLNVEMARVLSAQRTTTLLVTHSVDEAVFLADRVVVMTGRPGRVKRVVDVPFGPGRDSETQRLPAFQSLVAELTLMLDGPAGEAS